MASAAVVSGKSPKASESTTDTIRLEFLCLSIADIKLALVPTVTTSSTPSSDSCAIEEIEIDNIDRTENNFLYIIYLLFVCKKQCNLSFT